MEVGVITWMTWRKSSSKTTRRRAARLAGATDEDRRLVLEAVGASVIVQQNAAWELELEVPRLGEPEVQTVVKGLGKALLEKRFPQDSGGGTATA